VQATHAARLTDYVTATAAVLLQSQSGIGN